MLHELSIRQFAIIDDIRITFQDGLTIMSGETGAGKSIIINAVNLLLGSRASEKMIRTGADTAEVEALFQVQADSSVAQAMQAHDFPASENLLIRRIISRNKRHRVYINDRLSTMQVLKTIVRHMASISGQHAHQGLLQEDQQLLILDQSGGLLPLRKKVNQAYHQLVELIRKYHQLQMRQSQQQEHLALLQFQLREIQTATIVENEDLELEQEIARLKNAEQLYATVHASIDELYNASGAVVERILAIGKKLEDVSQIDSALSASSQTLSENAYRIEDVVSDLRDYLGKIQMDDQRLEEAEERLYLLNTLKRKYGGSLAAVSEKEAAIEQEIAQDKHLNQDIAETHNALVALQKKAIGLSDKLSQNRQTAAAELARSVEAELATLKMNQTRFEISLQPLGNHTESEPFLRNGDKILSESGQESVEFLIAPNVGEALKPMAEIASGGELSRIVLALKAILAQTDSVETVIFDEVDAGIGGTVAEVVGKKLAQLSRHHQVICITHLPQIARFGDHQMKITKEVRNNRTETAIQSLDPEERLQEIARMLAGENVTKKTLAHAAEMMERSSHN
jgi:DNA repair protein RecN (Recombination protein N)